MGTVSPGGAANKQPVLVAQGDRETVHLGFNRPLQGLLRENLLHPRNERLDLLRRVGVVETHHRHLVANRLKAGHRRATDALTGRIGCDQFRETPFELAQFPLQAVEFEIADQRPVEDMVGVLMPADLLHQFGVSLSVSLGTHFGRNWGSGVAGRGV